MAENTGPGENIGEPVEASDADGDELSYMLGGADAAAFEIDEVSGQLRTSDALDYERRSSYRVTVTAADTSGKSAVTDVTIMVINQDEDGALTLSSRQPQVGTSLTATLTDPDGSLISRGCGRDQPTVDLDNDQRRDIGVLHTGRRRLGEFPTCDRLV